MSYAIVLVLTMLAMTISGLLTARGCIWTFVDGEPIGHTLILLAYAIAQVVTSLFLSGVLQLTWLICGRLVLSTTNSWLDCNGQAGLSARLVKASFALPLLALYGIPVKVVLLCGASRLLAFGTCLGYIVLTSLIPIALIIRRRGEVAGSSAWFRLAAAILGWCCAAVLVLVFLQAPHVRALMESFVWRVLYSMMD